LNKHYDLAIQNAKICMDQINDSLTYFDITAISFFELKNFTKALEYLHKCENVFYYRESKEYSKRDLYPKISEAYAYLADSALLNKDTLKCIDYYRKSIHYYTESMRSSERLIITSDKLFLLGYYRDAYNGYTWVKDRSKVKAKMKEANRVMKNR